MKLKTCPFCNGEVELKVSDDEGNSRPDEYENDPWSGLTFRLDHPREKNKDCPIAHYEDEIMGTYLYESREEATEAWNNRKGDK